MYSLIIYLGWLCIVFGIMYSHRRRNKNAIITSWPAVGMLPGLLQNFSRQHEFATDILTRKSGGTFEFKGPTFLNLDFLMTCDPLNVHHILSTNFANYPKGPQVKEIFDVLGDGILNADSDLWRLQRRMFHLWNARNAKFDNLFVARVLWRKVVNDLAPFLDHASQTGIQIDLQDTFKQMLTFDNAILLIFGLDPESENFKHPKVQYQKAYEYMDRVVLYRHALPQFLWKLQRRLRIGSEREFARAMKIFDEFLYHCFSLKRDESKSTRNEPIDQEEANYRYLDMLTIYMEKKGDPYPDKFLRDMAISFVAASKDTLNSSLTWFFWLIATHPSVEAKILEEMRQNFPADVHGDMNLELLFSKTENLKKLVYLQAALFETLRLYPPLPFNHKMAVKEDTLPSGHRVKRNMRVLIALYPMGRMEEIWGQDCLEFKPERWISDQDGEFLHVPSHKFATFGTGPRSCLGKDIVLIQMKVVAIWVLRNYTLQVVEGHPTSPDLTITLYVKNGLMVRVSKRTWA